MTKRPVGFTIDLEQRVVAQPLGDHRVDDHLGDVAYESARATRSGSCWVEMTTVSTRFGRVAVVLDGDLRLAVRTQIASASPFLRAPAS